MFDYWSRKLWDGRRSLELLVTEHQSLSQREKEHLFKSNVELINFELSKHCNRKCNYCPVSHSTRHSEQQIIEKALFDRVLEDLSRISYSGTISLNLYNEPLLNPQLIEQLGEIRQALPKAYISFNSNGDSLNKNKLSSLAEAGLNHICVTLHPKPDTVISEQETLRRITALLKKIDFNDAETMNIPCIVSSSAQLSVRKLGVGVRIQWPDWNVLGGSRGGDIAVLDLGKPIRQKPCVRPFREFTLYYDGTSTPCCEIFHDGTAGGLVTGRVQPEGVNDIFAAYSNTQLDSFRRSVFDYSKKDGVCKHCPVADFGNGSDAKERAKILYETETLPERYVAGG